MPLLGIPRIISPELLKILAEMVRTRNNTRLTPGWNERPLTSAAALLRGSAVLLQGHGDELCLADCNFPAQSVAEAQHNPRLVHVATDSVTLLAALLRLLPLDQYVAQPAGIMDRVPADKAANFPVEIYAEYQRTLDEAWAAQNPPASASASASASSSSSAAAPAAAPHSVSMELIERFAFYERAKKCFAVVQTTEKRQYGNIIIKKGVVRADA